jgi:hypothetical protein
MVLLSFLTVMRKSDKLNPYYIIGFSIWIAFQAQLLISINQIGNAVWGWALGGILLGYSYLTDDQSATDKNEKNSKKQKVQKSEILPASDLLRLTGGTVLALVIVFPYWNGAVNFQNAIESQSVKQIEEAALEKPYDLVRMVGTSRVLSDNGFTEQAKAVLKITIENFPDSYAAWEALSKLPDTPEARMKEIKTELLRLDPRVNPAP